MKHFLLLLAAAAAVCGLTTPPPSKSKNCIDDCTCTFSKLPSRLQITNCNKPLVLNAKTFEFINKASINVISLENLIIRQIQENAFSGFPNLEDVIIYNTNIGSMDDKSFNNVTRLKFQRCGFEDTPELFSMKLEEIHFGECNLEEIPNLNGLLSLDFLNLSGNYIKNIEIEAFAELFELKELYLSNNEIFKLPATSFINNQELSTLNLDNNPLRHFALNTTESLETLSLKNCQLESFDEESTKRLTLLNELVLSHNKLSSIDSKTLSHMKELSVIDLSYNNLNHLDDNIFAANSKLIKVSLDGNKLQSLPEFYLNNNEDFSMYAFSCKNCSLKQVSGAVFKNMDGLINLELSHNQLKNVDNTFENIKSLKLLDISNNDIEYLSPQTFVHNRNLETVNIASNPLMELNPEVFAGTPLLRDIDARNTSLRKLWSNYNKQILHLRKLLISNNNLNRITDEDIKIMPNLEAIDLNLNPFYFDLDLCMVLHHLAQKNVIPIEYTKNINTGFEKTFGEDIDGFSPMEWKEFHHGDCPDHYTSAPTKAAPFETTKSPIDDYSKIDAAVEDLDDDDDDDDDDAYDYSYDDFDEDESSTRLPKHDESLVTATYILSVTSVFVLSALVVLTVAVTLTLCVLRRNNRIEMQRANLPRLKIPLWSTAAGQKKHSGSVYRPLSEDLSGPKTPKLSRYEFTSNPVVHTA